MKLPAYLWRNRYGTYYFRIVIPKLLCSYFAKNKRELRRSLSTDSKKEALRRARIYRVRFDFLFEQLNIMTKKKSNTSIYTGYIGGINFDLGNGRSLKIDKIDHDGDHEKEKETLRAAVTAAIANNPITDEKIADDSILVSQVIDEYCVELAQGGTWTSKTEQENRTTFKLLIGIIGDKPIATIDHAIIRHYKTTLQKLPANINKIKRYKDKSIKEIIAMPDVITLSVSTVNKQLNRTSSLFDWAISHGHMQHNYAKGIAIKEKKRADQQRDQFDKNELSSLFNGYIYKGEFPKRVRPHNYQFWIPLMGLYTGARIEELCKLRICDIRKEDDTWCLDTGVKTEAGLRLIPIHKKLIDFGFLDYIKSLKNKGIERLFPELEKKRDGYSQAA